MKTFSKSNFDGTPKRGSNAVPKAVEPLPSTCHVHKNKRILLTTWTIQQTLGLQTAHENRHDHA